MNDENELDYADRYEPEDFDIDYDSKYDTDEYKTMYFHTNFDAEYGDRLDDIRSRVGRDQEEAISIFADELMEGYHADIQSKEEMVEFINSHI